MNPAAVLLQKNSISGSKTVYMHVYKVIHQAEHTQTPAKDEDRNRAAGVQIRHQHNAVTIKKGGYHTARDTHRP